LRDRKAAAQFGAGVQADFQYFGFYRGLSRNGIVKNNSQGKEESQGRVPRVAVLHLGGPSLRVGFCMGWVFRYLISL
jgi:hypothetical protein